MKFKAFGRRYYNFLLSEKAQKNSEKWIIIISIASFLIHLGVIALIDLEIILQGSDYDLLADPIAAIYTPFSFILLYEVYLLIYYLPKSITTYIIKQYEIITLIVIRRIFKDLSKLDLTLDAWLLNDFNQQFVADILTTVLLFFFIWLFNRKKAETVSDKMEIEGFSDNLKVFRPSSD
ncbi:MAG TPA: hypothetical protein DDY13_14735, partial [Cytophagales bacterium]|jgi:hypothetical protein|nr:hypothetical protein [Cytophagales bacterium]